eukprot:CAMPEP_0119181392 /NCGR_PEP_ID=MMETSP1315-20130426/59302_1 /TAXON_ID=676789 /ORGANISM="Prasinoderma singularis, Strain RCC927" /LENGTH=103 /DNA_ID=CAMNT_0007175705 /DNA_START=66 /DNA_END=373 /DNA_ORIENTATION=-
MLASRVAWCSWLSQVGEYLLPENLLGCVEPRRHQVQLRGLDLLARAKEAEGGHLTHAQRRAELLESVAVVRVDLDEVRLLVRLREELERGLELAARPARARAA